MDTEPISPANRAGRNRAESQGKNMTSAEIQAKYISLRSSGLSEGDACRALMADGVSFQAAVDASWKAAKGTLAPRAGSLAAIRHDAAADRAANRY